MPTPTKGPRLGGGPAHERLMLANLATSLFEHDRITTTEAKAKRLRPLAERLVTFAKRGDLHARRRVMTVVRDKGVVHRLFVEIAPDVADRPGGYTRITRIAPRKGDNAPMVVIELVREPVGKTATVKRAPGSAAEGEGSTKRAAKQAESKRAAADTKAAEDAAKADDGTAAVAPVADVDADSDGTAVVAPTAGDVPEGAVAAHEDGSSPDTAYTIKGNRDSMKYHEPAGQWFDQTVAEVWFKSATDAEAAGFTHAGGGSAADVEVVEGEYAGSALPKKDGSAPSEDYTVKGNKDSMKFHEPDGQWFEQTVAEVWFKTATAAEAAGFTRAGG